MIYLRAADRYDASSLAQLRAKSLVELGLLPAGEVAAFATRAAREFFGLFRAERVLAWIACDADRVVASSCAVLYDRLPYPEGATHAEICGVYVSPAYRKRGFASELTREVIAAAHAAGARRLFLRPSKSAKSLYARLGFVETELMAYPRNAECGRASEHPQRSEHVLERSEHVLAVAASLNGYAALHEHRNYP